MSNAKLLNTYGTHMLSAVAGMMADKRPDNAIMELYPDVMCDGEAVRECRRRARHILKLRKQGK